MAIKYIYLDCVLNIDLISATICQFSCIFVNSDWWSKYFLRKIDFKLPCRRDFNFANFEWLLFLLRLRACLFRFFCENIPSIKCDCLALPFLIHELFIIIIVVVVIVVDVVCLSFLLTFLVIFFCCGRFFEVHRNTDLITVFAEIWASQLEFDGNFGLSGTIFVDCGTRKKTDNTISLTKHESFLACENLDLERASFFIRQLRKLEAPLVVLNSASKRFNCKISRVERRRAAGSTADFFKTDIDLQTACIFD